MANIKSAEKRVAVAKINNERNKAVKSGVRSITKKFEKAMAEGQLDEAKLLFAEVSKKVDKAASKGTIHKNTASRRKSRMALSLNKSN